jgi:chloramphenicol-sensitive protein RarD
MNPGLFAAALSYTIWGLFPLYFHQLQDIPALEVVLHRSVWSLLLLLGLLAAQGRLQWITKLLQQPRTLAIYAASAALLTCNWVIYVWAVQNGRVLEASLGYFINPLFNVLLGVLVLQERPRHLQWLAIGIAALGVLWLGWVNGAPPWISLALASSFGLYGLLKKQAPLGALEGLTVETLLMAPIAIPGLLWLSLHGGTLATASLGTWAWLLAAGPLTAAPLLLFAFGAKRIPMTTLGLLQYLSPSLQFMLGIWVFHETFQTNRMLGFVLIWTALVIYSADSLWRLRRRPLAAA